MKDHDLQINIGSIKIGSIDSSSALNIGKNTLQGFRSLTKNNQGLGEIYGDKNGFPSNINWVEDPDLYDQFSPGARESIDLGGKEERGVRPRVASENDGTAEKSPGTGSGAELGKRVTGEDERTIEGK
jgi:hypothetical protein